MTLPREKRDEKLRQRIDGKYIKRDDGCWSWTASKTRTGYGQIGPVQGSSRLAHRVSYELHVGPIPDGLVIDHLCRNRACVNPAHLEPVTARENIMRGTSPAVWQSAKTHCARGHAFDAENTYITRGRFANRRCRKCAQQTKRSSYERIAATRGKRVRVILSPEERESRRQEVLRMGGRCSNGHRLDDKSIYVPPYGGVACRVCHLARYHAKQKGRAA
jgi:hypothetical protein